MTRLQVARAQLKRMTARLPGPGTCMGVPIEEFDREDLSRMLQLKMAERQTEREVADGAIGMWRALYKSARVRV